MTNPFQSRDTQRDMAAENGREQGHGRSPHPGVSVFGAGWGQPVGASGQGQKFGTRDFPGRLENSMGNFLFVLSEAQLSKKLLTP